MQNSHHGHSIELLPTGCLQYPVNI